MNALKELQIEEKKQILLVFYCHWLRNTLEADKLINMLKYSHKTHLEGSERRETAS